MTLLTKINSTYINFRMVRLDKFPKCVCVFVGACVCVYVKQTKGEGFFLKRTKTQKRERRKKSPNVSVKYFSHDPFE